MKKILFLSLGVFLMAACGNDNNAEQTDLLDSINAIEQAVGNPGTVYTADTAEMLVNLYNRFVNEFPEDSLTPIFMMRTAEIEINRGYRRRASPFSTPSSTNIPPAASRAMPIACT